MIMASISVPAIPKPDYDVDVPQPTVEEEDDAIHQPLLPLQSPRRRRRLLDRDADFSQSRGRWNLQHTGREMARQHTAVARRLWDHWFYNVSYQRTPVLMLILFVTYTLLVVLYASIYLAISRIGQSMGDDQNEEDPDEEERDGKTTTFCNMGISTFMEAMYFSLSTMTTIVRLLLSPPWARIRAKRLRLTFCLSLMDRYLQGYGVSDYYFGGCWAPLVMVLLQVCTAVTFDAIAVGLLYQRFSRGHKRRKTIVISNECIVMRVQGTLYWMCRIADLRRQATLLNASVRAYCVYHDRRRIMDHDDGSIAIETTHFVTRPVRLQHQAVHDNILLCLPQVVCHAMDDTSPLRPSAATAAMGDGSCGWLDARGEVRAVPPPDLFDADVEHIRAYWLDRDLELIVIVEGMDELTGASIEARHSYTVDNVAWNRSFVSCTDATATVDFARFHETVPAALNYPHGHAYVF
jgi:Inward rectifier potassium channel C-terminal domain